jgi:hypothetical protein
MSMKYGVAGLYENLSGESNFGSYWLRTLHEALIENHIS